MVAVIQPANVANETLHRCTGWKMKPDLDSTLAQIVTTPGAELAGLAVAAVVDGAIVYEGYWGRQRILTGDPSQDRPVTAATRFRVASITKTTVALGVMRLVEQGRIDLDADVSDYLGFTLHNPHYPGHAITPRMLLTHTSSLRDGEVYAFPLGTALADAFRPDSSYWEEGAHFAAPLPGTDTAPGRYFTYCNLGYGVLGTLIECISGERFDVYMARHVLEPLGLGATFDVRSLPPADLDNLATLYRKQCDGVWNPDGPWCAQVDDYRGQPPPPLAGLDAYVIGTNGTLFSPAGGLRASAHDLVRLMQCFVDGSRGADTPVVMAATIRAMLTEQWRYSAAANNGAPYDGLMRAFGLGLHHLTGSAGDAGGPGDRIVAGRGDLQWWGHTGDAYGLLSAMLFDAARNCGFVYVISGVGRDPEAYKGAYSAFYRWEEQIQSAIFAAGLLQ
jgi:CubicO group peptidase (beta-lactamase class C family)